MRYNEISRFDFVALYDQKLKGSLLTSHNHNKFEAKHCENIMEYIIIYGAYWFVRHTKNVHILE